MNASDALAALHARLRTQSGFAQDAIGEERLRMLLASRAIELRLPGAEDVARRALADAGEYGRIEAHFAPSETWLFRYRESFDLVREFAESRRVGSARVLVLGAGGWCEPVGLAIALMAGGCARPSVFAVDRHAPLFARPARFAGIDLRGGIPPWAEFGFTREGEALAPRASVLAAVTTSVGDVAAAARGLSDRGEQFDLVAFRNVAIYLNAEMRSAVFAAINGLLAPEGLLLVGHAELAASVAATGLEPHPSPRAFALRRPRPVARGSVPVAAVDAQGPVATPALPDRTPRRTHASSELERLRSDIAAQPTSAHLQARLALALADAADWDGAFEAAMRALYLDRHNEDALLLAARISEERGAAGDAERFRQRALRAHLESERSGRGDERTDA